MSNIHRIELAWKLHQSRIPVSTIASSIERDRATVFRWLKGIRLWGIKAFTKRYRTAKHRARSKRIDPRAEPLLIERRRAKEYCGQKLSYWLKKVHGISVSVAQIYRILHKHFTLRSKWQKWVRRPALPRASKPREVIQVDSVDLGELYLHTVIDTWTKEAAVIVVDNLEAATAAAALETAMAHFGTAAWIQTDNGSEYKATFRTTARRYCTTLRQITPYQKEENAFIESFNRTVRKECVGWRTYRREEQDQLQAYLDAWLIEYHTERPHLSLKMATPVEFLNNYLHESHLT